MTQSLSNHHGGITIPFVTIIVPKDIRHHHVKNKKNIIQDLIENGVIELDNQQATSNSDHTIFKNPLHDHGMSKGSSLGTKTNN